MTSIKTDLSLNVLKTFHFAFFRFRINNMLTNEEEEHKEGVLQAKGIKCDARLLYMSVTLRSPEISYYISRIK